MKLPGRPERSKKAKALGAVRSNPVRAVGALTLIGGLAAAVARKLKGGTPDPFADAYEPADAAASTNGGAAPPMAAAPDPVGEVEAEAVAEAPEPEAAEPQAVEPEAAEPESVEAPADEEPPPGDEPPPAEERRGDKLP